MKTRFGMLQFVICLAFLTFGLDESVGEVIDFEGFPTSSFSGALGSEDGFDISATGGLPFIDDFGGTFGNPGNGFFNDTSGTSIFVFEAGGTPFTFDSFDIIGGLFNAGSGDITVEGYLNNSLQQTDVFSPTNVYTTVNSSNLSGVAIDRLEIQMPAFGVAADNLVLATVPEPASIAIWSLIGSSLAGFGYTRKRRKK